VCAGQTDGRTDTPPIAKLRSSSAQRDRNQRYETEYYAETEVREAGRLASMLYE